MSASQAISDSVDQDKGASDAPNWDQVPFDVECARCGHDLCGLSEPKCTSCGLEFDWSDAVPIEKLLCSHCDYHLYGLSETRCPECGEPFTWPEALDDYHRRKKPLFEYWWRKKPFSSLCSSWWLSIRPWKLWQVVDMHDPPRGRPLLVIVVVAFVTLALLVPTITGVALWLNGWFGEYLPGGWRIPGLADFVPAISLGFEIWLRVGPVLALWCMTSLGTLMIFRESMRIYRVRPVHVLRVWAYAFFGVLLLMVPAWSVVMFVATILFTSPLFHVASSYSVWLIPAGITFCLWVGYKRYLHMRHSLAVAIASQVIAILAVAVVVVVLAR
ncbi:MAG: hypothetical protein JSU63_06755 [Phycisphaerales bacterium]|nr:MAG: hypothetical protein JSU63_06755 [Phycisphaerales bacterium]